MLKRTLLTLALVALPSTLNAATSPFIGKWKVNPAKSTLHDQMKVTAAGTNRYAFDFGGGSEFIVVNGADQPGLAGSTLSVTPKAPRIWQVVRKKDGRMQISAIWTLAADDTTLRDDFTGYQVDGSHFTIHYLYDRIAGTGGFAGTWDSTSEKAQPEELQIEAAESGALSFRNLAQHSTKLLRFDGKDYRVEDAKTPPGAFSSARRVDDHTIKFTEKRNGKIADTQHIEVSADGKMLTMTIQPASGRRPDVLVFERE